MAAAVELAAVLAEAGAAERSRRQRLRNMVPAGADEWSELGGSLAPNPVWRFRVRGNLNLTHTPTSLRECLGSAMRPA